MPAKSKTVENIAKICQTVRENHQLDRETVRKILTEDLDMRKVCKNGPKGAHRRTKAELLANKQVTVLEHTHTIRGSSPQ
jgi:hypothetical protein